MAFNQPQNNDDRDRSRERDRNRRSDRPNRINSASRDRSRERNDRRKACDRRIYVSNIPYDFRWQDLKDLFRTEVGKVAHVELFTDENDKPRGCGIVEFEDSDSVKIAVEKMHRYDIKGRKLVVKELDYKVDEKKLLEVFKLAGKVLHVELGKDKDGKSRGFGVVEYDHPVESVQAISMLHNQQLFDRRMTVRLDRANEPDMPPKLPEGLKGIGMGLGAGGNRLMDVARNIPNVQANNPPMVNPISAPVLAAGAFGAGLNNVVPAQLASALSNTNAAALQASLAGAGLGANLTTSSLLNSSLTNELASNLNNFGGGVGSLSGLQASLAGGQGNNSFAPRGLSKLDNDIGFGGNNAFGGSNFGGGGRDFDSGSFNRGDGDRISGGGGGGFSGNQGQSGGGNRQNSNGSRPLSDTILISNLPPNTTWQMLRDKFQDAGEVKFAEMRGTDMGMVRFASEWDADRAVSILSKTKRTF
ncbi:Heterogeneous nuclear ribonucleoprotein M [Ooceraea biroi]|uniref:Heterogeneous nuclear ribonucleoprotein M n=1 Tax=Ooceraea biroi TaxID=2015173 RepID=A0A026WX46_OOCBI|nr:Heterogeneous nuclear ribonucleoprotein M [Ooceraea biroi]